ncbi:unnamed protein product [Anisakis simplex]|uniref:ABC2_membrane domain-containing protein n=1 Tax=Anisakis simplex TaxID=6269 RepID=A0A0M3JIA1_ANISI|nr:unnamed protein product [Anisakis simplex]
MAIGFVVLFVAIMNAPNFLTYKIIEMRLNETCEIQDESVRYAPAYIPGVSDMAVQAYCLVGFSFGFLDIWNSIQSDSVPFVDFVRLVVDEDFE